MHSYKKIFRSVLLSVFHIGLFFNIILKLSTLSRFFFFIRKFVDKVAEFKKKKDAADAARRHSAATTMQALARGVLGRKVFKKNLPNLKRALKQRNFCVECEANIAQKRCRQCKDRFCNGCYEKCHAKGTRSVYISLIENVAIKIID
jgi:hypothetical protein